MTAIDTSIEDKIEFPPWVHFRYLAILCLLQVVIYGAAVVIGIMVRGGLVISSDVSDLIVTAMIVSTVLCAREFLPFLFWICKSAMFPPKVEVPETIAPATPIDWLKYRMRYRPPSAIGPGYVYIIREMDISGYYKIGRSKSPIRRIADFRLVLPFNIEVVHLIQTNDCANLERVLHMHFASKRVRGEWFALTTDDLDYLRSLVTE